MIKILATTILIVLMASIGYCANSVVDNWNFTICPDTNPPYVVNKFPAPNAVGIPIDSKISCNVRDDETGVDINTIVMKVNNVAVMPNITGAQNDYLVEYTPGLLPWNQIINVSIDADDLAD